VGTTGSNASNLNATTNTLKSVSGTGIAGDTIYLYDNLSSNLVGTSVVQSDGTWTVSSLSGTYTGSNTFAAVQVDVQGNQSVASNLWTVTSNVSSLVNSDFSSGNTGFTSSVPYSPTVNFGSVNYAIADKTLTGAPPATTTSAVTPHSKGTWYDSTVASYTANDATAQSFMSGKYFIASIDGMGSSTSPLKI
jgi:hypothetical protein